MKRQVFLIKDEKTIGNTGNVKLTEIKGKQFYEVQKSKEWQGRKTLRLASSYDTPDDYEIIVEVSEPQYSKIRREQNDAAYNKKKKKDRNIVEIPYDDAIHEGKIDCGWDGSIHACSILSPVEIEVIKTINNIVLLEAFRVCLSETEKMLIFYRYICTEKILSYRATSKKMGISKGKVKRMEERCLVKMKKYINKNGGGS